MTYCIASRFTFGFFAIGAITDGLQVRALNVLTVFNADPPFMSVKGGGSCNLFVFAVNCCGEKVDNFFSVRLVGEKYCRLLSSPPPLHYPHLSDVLPIV